MTRREINQAAYQAAHRTVREKRGPAYDAGPCARCGIAFADPANGSAFEWAFVGSDAQATGFYRWSPVGPPELYAPMCVPCHRDLDHELHDARRTRAGRRRAPSASRCVACGTPLVGGQTSYCSKGCSNRFLYRVRRDAGELWQRREPSPVMLAPTRAPVVFRPSRCAECGGPLAQRARGRPKTTCSARCRKRASRRVTK